uniref:Uncharacterized protein n=1 Tax=Maylandia zebra TaxID=106582 RepID=A0A3P9B431_9CICH
MSEKNFRPWTEKVFFSWFLCALIYPILKELRAERVTGEDGTEEKMLGFWSLLVLSPGMDFPTLRTPACASTACHEFPESFAVLPVNDVTFSISFFFFFFFFFFK